MKYQDINLPNNQKWEDAFVLGVAVLKQRAVDSGADMSVSVDKEYKKSALSLVNCLREHCTDLSEDLITVALLGPAGAIYALSNEKFTEQRFGSGVVNILKEMQYPRTVSPVEHMKTVSQDVKRMFLASTILNMKEFIIPALKENKMNITSVSAFIRATEAVFASVKGHEPALKKTFEKNMREVKSLANFPHGDNTIKAQKKPRPPTF